jgi:hypothetical protein
MDNKPTNNKPPRQNRGSSRPNRQSNGGNGAQNSNGNGEKKQGVSRGAAVRAQKRIQMDAQRVANQYMPAPTDEKRRANFIDDSPRLKIIGLGGMDGGGSKNTMLIEYVNDAVIIDAGNDLSVDLPGINYGIADMAYLEGIKHKLRAYVITHGQ